MQNRGLNRAQQQEVRYRSSPNLPIAQQQPASNSVGRVRHSSVEGMPKGAGRGGSVQGPRLGIVAEEEVGRAPRGPSPQRPASAQPQKGNQAPTESRLQYLESELASFTSKMTEMRTAAEALQEEVRVVRPSLDGTGKAPSSAATSIGPPHNGGSDEMDSEATGTWVLDALKKVLADRERHGTEFGSPPNIGTSNTSNTSNAPDDSTLQELRALHQEVRLEAEARKQLSLKMEAMFLDEKKKRDEVIRQAVMQREEQDSKIEQRWQGQLKEESSLRRAVESHLEARLVALQREARLEAGNATSQAQQAVGEFVQMRERLQQEMNAQKQEIGRASADLSRLIDEVRNHGGALKADMGMPSAEITENLVRAEVRRQLAERPAETDMATSLELQALSTRFERLEQTLANEATTRQEESSKSISMLQELTSELGKSQMQALREFEETFKTKLNAAMSEAQAAQQTCVEERQLRRQQLAKETKDREEICMGILRTMEERIVSESQKLQKLLSDQKLSFEQLLRGHDRELQSTMEMSIANFVEKHSQDVVSTRHDLLELREELQEAVRSKRFDQPSVTSQGEVQRLVDGQTKLWATLDQVRQDLSEEIQRKDLATRTGPATLSGLSNLDIEELRTQIAAERLAREQGDDRCMENARDLVNEEERKRGRELVALESRMSSVKVQMPQMQEETTKSTFLAGTRAATTSACPQGVVSSSIVRPASSNMLQAPPWPKPPSFSA